MKRIFILISLLLFLFANYAFGAGPIKTWWLDGEGKPVETACDTASNCDTSVSPFELHQDLKDAVDDAATADLVYIPGTIYTDYSSGPPYSKKFYVDVHDYYRTVNPDIYLLPYGNYNNWAGNIFHHTQVEDDGGEGHFLHHPYDDLDQTHRVIPTYHSVVDQCSSETSNFRYYIWDDDFQDFFTSHMVTVMGTNNKLDGIFLDNGGVKSSVAEIKRCVDNVQDYPQNPATQIDYTVQEQHDEKADMITEIHVDLEAAYPTGNWDGAKMMFPINVGFCLDDEEKDMIANMDGTNILGGALSEGSGWFAHEGTDAGEGAGYRDCDQDTWISSESQYTVAAWKHQVDAVKWLMDEGYMFMGLFKQMREDHNGDESVDDEDWIAYPNSKLLFIYASTLLAAGNTGDMCFFKYGTANQLTGWEGLDQDIGVASGDYAKWPGSDNIYYRLYTDGLVLVNPSASNETVDPGFTYQRFVDGTINSLDWTGLSAETSGNIQVDAYSAEILYGQSGAPASQHYFMKIEGIPKRLKKFYFIN